MGTKIQCKTVLPAFYSAKDINGSVSNGMCLLSHDERTLRIGQPFDSFSSRLPIDGYFEYEKEKVRQTILKHESTFRHQLQELHRLYIRQRDLMNDLKMRELHMNPKEAETLHSTRCLSHTPPEEVKRTWHIAQAPSSGTHYTQHLFECKNALNRTGLFSGKEVSRLGDEDKQGADPVRHDSVKRTNCLADLNEPILIEDTSDANPHRTICLVGDGIQKMKKFHEDYFVERNGGNCLKQSQSIHGGNRLERLTFDINADAQSDDLPAAAFPPSQADTSEAREPLTTFPNRTNAEVQKKKTIFGVVISDDNREPFSAASSGNINSLKQSLDTNGNISSSVSTSKEIARVSYTSDLTAGKGQECSLFRFDSVNRTSPRDLVPKIRVNTVSAHHETKQESCKGSGTLPWFIAAKSQQISRGENGYHMNLDLLQNCSRQFFKKSETERDLNQKQEDTQLESTNACEKSKNDAANIKKIFGVPIFNCSISRASFLGGSGENPGKVLADKVAPRNQIDLNLSIDEEEAKIATTEIDLEAPAVLEYEENLSDDTKLGFEKTTQPREVVMREAAKDIVSISSSSCANNILNESESTREEVMREAAEAIVSISSSSGAKNLLNEAESSDCLKWFADLICSSGKGQGSVLDGMDYFEFMTLELRDMNEEGNYYEPSVLEIHFDDEEETGAAMPKRPRRGQARQGRQRRDFQRDVLPSLVSLSRHEVSEDILTFEELLKTTGSSWQSRLSQRKSAKNGRGRRRCGNSTPSLIKTIEGTFGSLESNNFSENLKSEKKESKAERTSLTGWGKRTRRLPRQRCPNTNPAPPLKQW